MGWPHLASPGRLGEIPISNRIVMAPMSRKDAGADGVPGGETPGYYRDRADAGLIITGATWVQANGIGARGNPGIADDIQAAAWRDTTEAVHRAGGRIVLQLGHAGALAPQSLLEPGERPLSPSGIELPGTGLGAHGPEPYSPPRALDSAEIRGLIDAYAAAARRARAAGFDGVEVDAAGGKLIDQFLRERTNRRSDPYGGDGRGRSRFLIEVLEAVNDAFGKGRVGLRLSPLVSLKGSDVVLAGNDIVSDYGVVCETASHMDLAYIAIVETARFGLSAIRTRVTTPSYLAGGGYDAASADRAIAEGHAHAVAFASHFTDPAYARDLLRDAAGPTASGLTAG